MFTRHFSKLILASVVTFIVSYVPSAAWAERADREKPVNLEANRMQHDDAKQVSIYIGDVVFSRGSMLIKGERVTVRQDTKGFQFSEITAAPGSLIFFRQKREGVDEYQEGEAERLDYDGRNDTIRLSKRAMLRRVTGGKVLLDEVRGEQIDYDNKTETYFVNSQTNNNPGATTSEGGGRIRAIIAPREGGSAPRLNPVPGR